LKGGEQKMANNNNPDFEIIALTENSWVDEPEPLGGDPGFVITGCGGSCGSCDCGILAALAPPPGPICGI